MSSHDQPTAIRLTGRDQGGTQIGAGSELAALQHDAQPVADDQPGRVDTRLERVEPVAAGVVAVAHAAENAAVRTFLSNRERPGTVYPHMSVQLPRHAPDARNMCKALAQPWLPADSPAGGRDPRETVLVHIPLLPCGNIDGVCFGGQRERPKSRSGTCATHCEQRTTSVHPRRVHCY